MKVIQIMFAIMISVFVSVSHAAIVEVELKVEKGMLMGADNVLVLGRLFNVRFIDGTCTEVFSGCDDTNDFVFTNNFGYRDIGAASQALLDYVFVASPAHPLYDFDNNPSAVNGCSDAYKCQVHTPHEFSYRYEQIFTVAAINGNEDYRYRDEVSYTDFNYNYYPNKLVDLSLVTYQTWAVWTEVVETSEPNASIIFLLGIAGLLVSRRQRPS